MKKCPKTVGWRTNVALNMALAHLVTWDERQQKLQRRMIEIMNDEFEANPLGIVKVWFDRPKKGGKKV